ncbi:hypothetical protein QO239_22965 [Cupriavidus taiwanensis]|uniref:hypothetical protein n=1 Tax=Cupriavidus taiwanensis TaxID=164546 RepID=UPI00254220EB|nr:hypothetical protein [Cupriavidus taiwanensis]MDK3025461.1 hypothetical protein [Cupriavidus taiwanensis]
MYQAKAQHALSSHREALSDDINEAMWRLFRAIGDHWQIAGDPSPFRSRLQSFMANRIALMPLYSDYYNIAKRVVDELTEQLGSEEAAYQEIFTNKDALGTPPTTPLALTRQSVANEFLTLYMALGGFNSFGALNWPGYFGGANVPGGKAPYRPME